MASATDFVRSHDMLPMTVAKMGFLVDKLNQDCSPLQFLRELTKNAFEAIENLDASGGEIRWDVDWNRFDLSGLDAVQKLCIIDSGVGMTGVQMVEFINKLSSSIHEQSTAGNFGVGAKISAAPLNPEGLIYLSWVDGQGYMIHLIRDGDTGDYGLLRFSNGEFWQKMSDDLKPETIDKHGTMVILLGRSPEDNTIEPPADAKMPRKWILRYLNSRFFRIPEGVNLRVREGWDLPRDDRHNFLRTVTGQGAWLDENSEQSGSVRLSDTAATVYWWIIRNDVDTNSGHYAPTGHVAALYQNELYELVYGPAGYARLQSLGVVFGGQRVVIYVEPDSGGAIRISANTARTQLLSDQEPLDWPAYASEFRAKMPEELVAYQDQAGLNAVATDHRAAIRERLKTIRDLFRFGRYRPKPSGPYNAVSSENTGGEVSPSEQKAKSDASAPSGSRGGRRGDIYALFAEEEGEPSAFVDLPTEPEVKWVTLEAGTRNPGDMEDRAGKFLADQNILLINGDFRVFTDMIERWTSRYDQIPGSRKSISEVVHEWFEQQLIETIMSAVALKQAGKWSMQELIRLWSEDALTAAVLPRYHIDVAVKRVLGQRLGSLAKAA